MEAVITDAKRTIFARENGLLKDCLPEDLAAPLIRHLSRNMPEDIDEVLIGNATGRGGNLARLSALAAGLPLSVSGTTIDRQCGSGLDAVRVACHFVKAGAGACTSREERRAAAVPLSLPGRAFLLNTSAILIWA